MFENNEDGSPTVTLNISQLSPRGINLVFGDIDKGINELQVLPTEVLSDSREMDERTPTTSDEFGRKQRNILVNRYFSN